jgi:hypothetical protein
VRHLSSDTIISEPLAMAVAMWGKNSNSNNPEPLHITSLKLSQQIHKPLTTYQGMTSPTLLALMSTHSATGTSAAAAAAAGTSAVGKKEESQQEQQEQQEKQEQQEQQEQEQQQQPPSAILQQA